MLKNIYLDLKIQKKVLHHIYYIFSNLRTKVKTKQKEKEKNIQKFFREFNFKKNNKEKKHLRILYYVLKLCVPQQNDLLLLFKKTKQKNG